MRAIAVDGEASASRFATWFCVGAGSCDGATGVLLLTFPRLVVRLLGVPPPSGETIVYLRFLGVFVACVGAAYLLPLFVADRAARERRMVAAIDATAFTRLAVALFLAGEVIARGLAAPWLLVGAFDGVVGVAQLALRERGVFGNEV